MGSNLLNTSSTLQCPHGGSVKIVSTNMRVKADGVYAALSTDTFTISGCPFQLPTTPPTPSPCVTVRWVVTAMRNKTNSTPNLTQSSVGICQAATQIPQGSVIIAQTQMRASGM